MLFDSTTAAPRRDGAHRLGNGHISARRPSSAALLTFLPGGVIVKRENNDDLPHGGGGKRKSIKGFSRASKRRFDRFLATVQWASRPAHFVTLTYHFDPGLCSSRTDSAVGTSDPGLHSPGITLEAAASPGWRIWKDDLRAFQARLDRAYPGRIEGGLWKQEYQDRGVVHYHLTVFWAEGKEPATHDFGVWVQRAWNEIAEPGDFAHFLHGSSVQVVYNVQGGKMRALMAYLSKYLAKTFDLEEETGRIWGKWGEIPTELLAEVWLPWRDFVWVTRIVRRLYAKSRRLSQVNTNWASFLAMGDGIELFGLLDPFMAHGIVVED